MNTELFAPAKDCDSDIAAMTCGAIDGLIPPHPVDCQHPAS